MVRTFGDLLVRLIWLAMAAVHIAPVLRLSGSALAGELNGARWISLAALLLSMGFFGLKTLGVGFLRIRCRWTGLAVFLVACGLLHGNATPHDWLKKTGYTVLICGTVAGVSETVVNVRVRRRLAGLASRWRGALTGTLDVLQRSFDRVEAGNVAAWMRLIIACHGPPRAPPARLVLLAC